MCVIAQSLENPKHLNALSSFKGHGVVSLLFSQPDRGPTARLLQKHCRNLGGFLLSAALQLHCAVLASQFSATLSLSHLYIITYGCQKYNLRT